MLELKRTPRFARSMKYRKYCNRRDIRSRDFDETPCFRPPGVRTKYSGELSVSLCLLRVKRLLCLLDRTGVSVGGITVSKVAFQAIDPGSTPGRCKCSFAANIITRV
ncbi:hypothetical protein AVEN_269514-1 [Araneus ventricosus]|uniref:Uncharacterized protein n=1 Tax=Araneus ventricosus TaxID=182803 RepID=A0A4Y2R485_ARAVE|nr:hypothetical protein AVEN_269514-1 [Araneus ventricosus]